MPLWHLPVSVEEQFETQWATWTEQHEQWNGFFEELQGVQGRDLLVAMLDLEIITNDEAQEARKLRRAADNRAVPLPGVHQPCRETMTLLATGFFRGEPGQPAVPYARLEDA
ncbi:MAG TPA: BrxE family protein [Thermoguttaceae bacterium]|nr:BrxE family protein [Thermoguttaceae bacterium]